MRIEIIKDDNVLYPVTNSSSVTGYKNYNVKQIYESLSKAAANSEVVNKKSYVCDKDGLFEISLSDFLLDAINNAYDLYIYLNGSLLQENKDYFILDNTTVSLKEPTRVNDIFIFETISKIKYLGKTDYNFGCELNEKIHINNIFTRINTYCKK